MQHESRQLVGASFEGLVKAGILAGDPQLLAHVFWASLHGLLAGKLPAKPDFRAIHREAMRLLVAGASAGAAMPRPRMGATARRRAR
jgi:hypothetical protein